MDLYSAPSGYLHSPTICHRLVAEDLSKWPWPAEMLLFHYIDDILLTSDSLAELEKAVPQALSQLKSCGWAASETKLWGPGLSVKSWGLSGGVRQKSSLMCDR